MATRSYSKITVGGYSLEIVSAIHDSLYCSLCSRVLSDPRCTPCGCRFCSECIREHLGSSTRRCPGGTDTCIDLQYNNDVMVDITAGIEVGKLFAKCPFESCGGAFEVGKIKGHLDTEEIKDSAVHQVVSGGSIESGTESMVGGISDLNKEEQLLEGNTPCVHCGRSLTSLAMKTDHHNFDHADLCDKYEDYCPYGCGVAGKVLWKDHSRTCEANKVSCPYERLGCDTRCRKAGMNQHLVEDAYRHTEVLLKHIDNLNNELTILRLRPPTVVKEERVQDYGFSYDHTIQAILNSTTSNNSEIERIGDNFSFYCGEFCWKMTNFRLFPSKLRYSPCFYTHRRYRMQMEITTGDEPGFLSIYTKLAKGDYDDELQWPFTNRVTVRILDLDRRGRVYSQSISYGNSANKCQKRPHKFNQAFGWPNFICINELRSKPYLFDEEYIWIDCFVDE